MEKEAIQKDVSEEAVEVKSPRLEAMDAIVAKNREVPVEPEEEPEEELVEEEEEKLDDENVTIKVDGKEVQVPKKKVQEAGVRTLQKESTADKRLEEAAKRQKALDELERQLIEKAQSLGKKSDLLTGDIGKLFTESVLEDEEKAAQILNALAAKQNNIESIVSTMVAKDNTTRAQRVADQQDAATKMVNYFHSTYDDIANDDVMTYAINLELASSVGKKNLYSTEEIDGAADKVYERFGKHKVDDTKKKMPRTVKRAGTRMAEKPEPKQKTSMDILNDMRRQRGQPSI